MMIESKKLLRDLCEYVCTHKFYTEALVRRADVDLKHKFNENEWSVLECIEHLNLYASFYNKEIRKRMDASNASPVEFFKSGFWGNKFATDMLPKEGMKITNTMKTFKSKNPLNSELNREKVLSDFINHQWELLALLEIAKNKNLNTIKTSLTIPFLKFKLGDTFRFIIYHNERHIVQANKLFKRIDN